MAVKLLKYLLLTHPFLVLFCKNSLFSRSPFLDICLNIINKLQISTLVFFINIFNDYSHDINIQLLRENEVIPHRGKKSSKERKTDSDDERNNVKIRGPSLPCILNLGTIQLKPEW